MSSDGSDSEGSGSDINIKSALPKSVKTKKMPSSPTNDLLDKKLDKKLSTKIMIIQALVDLKSRKGVSMQAIKKYIAERYNVDTEKMKYYIKKSIKSGVEEGTIIQTKGIGASGSFKLAPVKEKKPKVKKPKEKKPKEKRPKTEKTEKTKDPEKKKTLKEKSKKTDDKSSKSKEKSKKPEGKSLKSKTVKESKEDKPAKPKKRKIDTEKMPEETKDGGEKAKKVKIAAVKHPKPKASPKKKDLTKRKSVGSIIKPPKMKPRAKA